jgi:hypothetical protein
VSEDVVKWLESPEGEAWSRETFAPADAFSAGVFGDVLPQPWGKPWRPSRERRTP